MTIGERLALLRGKMTQRDLARRAGVDVGTVSRIERGEIDPTYGTLTKLAAGLGRSVAELVALDQPAAPVPITSAPSVATRLEALEERQAAGLRAAEQGFAGMQRTFEHLSKVLVARGVLTESDRARLLHLLGDS